MGTWNYRIVKELMGDEVVYSIREVFYEDDEESEPEFYVSIEDFGLTADSLEELKDMYEKMGDAFKQSVLIEDEDGELLEDEDDDEEVEDVQ
jgi:hypothetical protein